MSIEQVVQSRYGKVATRGLSTNDASVKAIAEAFGYSADDLKSIPAEANMGLSCGNPTAMASLRPGETVVDLGSGGGLDVLLAAGKVGSAGKAIGIDMTPEMLELARKNASHAGVTNVEFHEATIDKLPLDDASVDCVISNCVINLASDKPAVFREIARVLKPGGRLAVSDIALKQPLPPEVGSNIMAYVGCIAGAMLIDDYRAALVAAGLGHVQVVDSQADLNVYAKADNADPGSSSASCSAVELPTVQQSSCCAGGDPSDERSQLQELLRRYNINDYAASVKVFAVKP